MSCACLTMDERINRGAPTARSCWGVTATAATATGTASYLNVKGTSAVEPSRLIRTYLR